MSNCFNIPLKLEVPKASCRGHVEVDSAVQRAVEKLVDILLYVFLRGFVSE